MEVKNEIKPRALEFTLRVRRGAETTTAASTTPSPRTQVNNVLNKILELDSKASTDIWIQRINELIGVMPGRDVAVNLAQKALRTAADAFLAYLKSKPATNRAIIARAARTRCDSLDEAVEQFKKSIRAFTQDASLPQRDPSPGPIKSKSYFVTMGEEPPTTKSLETSTDEQTLRMK